MAQYSAVDGLPGDFHLVHLGARALGGAGLVMAEMTCTSRRRPHHPRLPGPVERRPARRLGAASSTSCTAAATRASACSSATPGRRAPPTRRGTAPALDQPLPQGNWPLISASAQPYLADGAVPRAMTRADMDRVRDEFVAATRRAAEAGFDWLELHCAHGYLLSSLHLAAHQPAQRRVRRHAGEPAALAAGGVPRGARRLAGRQADVGAHLGARLGGRRHHVPDDAVAIARAFQAAGADMIDCSSGQVSAEQKPTYGRMYQTPFADRIRQEAGIATIAVGAISEADHVNSIIAAGRADLCAIARPHLANPAWTLTEAAKIGYTPLAWPRQYASGKSQMEANFQREKAQAAQAALSPVRAAEA